MTQLIEDIKEAQLINTGLDYGETAEVLYEKLYNHSQEFAFAYAKTITDKFGVLTEETFTEKAQEISEYTMTEDFKRALKVEQVKVLAELFYTVTLGLISEVRLQACPEDILLVMLANKRLGEDQSEATLKDMISNILYK